MKLLVLTLQIVVALGLLNVWLLRFNKTTAYRGGGAATMREEFAAYGLPVWFCYLVGFLKVTSALALLAGFFLPELVLPAVSVIAVLMIGALAMHIKVKDPAIKSLPAFLVLAMCLVILFASRVA